MATGIVLSVDPSGTTGQVQVDETGETFTFDDPNFPNTGLTTQAPNNSCTFDIVSHIIIGPTGRPVIVYSATNLQVAPATRTQTINTAYSGDITALVGDVITITSAAAVLTGNVTVNGGKVVIDSSAQVVGSININSDGIVAVKNKGTVRGNIVINSGGNLKVVNKGKLMGSIVIQQAGRMIVGNDNGSGSIMGAIDITQIRHLTITADSTINCG